MMENMKKSFIKIQSKSSLNLNEEMFLIGEGDFIMSKSLIIQEKIATDPNSLANRILQKLMKPGEFSDTTNINFQFVSKDEIYSVIETAE